MARRRRTHRGAVMVEYAFLLVAVALPTMAGIMYSGTKMLTQYQNARDQMLAPFP